jgi:hypothetical protein
MISKQQNAVSSKEDNSVFLSFKGNPKEISTGISIINGRYPRTGKSIDKNVTASWYCLEGSAVVCIGSETNILSQGDVCYVPKNTPFFIHGKIKLLVNSTPEWYSSQHKDI